MKVWRNALFIYPYKKPKKFFYYDLFPPLGLEYVATAVKDLVEKVTIIDMRYEKEPVTRFFREMDVIGISINWPRQIKILSTFLGSVPKEATVIVGGIHATVIARELMEGNPRIDILVRGDGEDILRDIFLRKPFSDIDGICYRQAGKVVTTPARKLLKKIEIIPDRSLRRYKYLHRIPFGLSFGIDTIMSSRGCPFNCEFCTHKLSALGDRRGWSYKSAELVVEEIKTVRSGIIIISDDNFTVDIKRVEKICDLIIAQKIKKVFMAECRIEIAEYPVVLEKMWKAGFRVLSFGIESAHDKTLERIGKGLTIREIKEAFQVLKKYKMICLGYFIVGYIGEDEKDMLEISSFAHSLELDFIILSKLRAPEYSPLRDVLRNTQGYYIKKNGRVYSDQYPPSRLSKIVRGIRRDFYTPSQYVRVIKKFIKSCLIFKLIVIKAVLVFQIGRMEISLKKRFMRPV